MGIQDRPVPSFFIIPLTLFLVGLLLFIALLHGQRDLTLLTLLVLVLAIGAKLWARMSLSGIECHALVDKQKVFPGERLTLRVTTENRKFLPIWFRTEVPVSSQLLPSPDGKPLVKEGSLLWYQKTRLDWELTAQQRGVYQVGPPFIAAGDLFAFFSKEKRAEGTHTVIVYPRLVPLRPFSLQRRDFFGIPGAKSPVQDPVYILGTRDYQHGQPAKYIHWKATARHNRLQEKIFEPSEQEKVLLILRVDQFVRHKAEETFEHTLEVAASFAVRLVEKGNAVGLVTNGALVGEERPIVPISRSQQQLPSLLETLARLRMESREDLTDLFRSGLELPWGLSCLLFTYEEDVATAALEEYFRQRKTPMLTLVHKSPVRSTRGDFKFGQRIRYLDEIASPLP